MKVGRTSVGGPLIRGSLIRGPLIRVAAVLGALAPLVLPGLILHAEDAPPPRLSFDLSSTLSQSTNPDLLASGGQGTTAGSLGFGLNFASDTRDQKFRLRLGSAWTSGEGFSAPGLSLSYQKTGAVSAVSVTAESRESAVDLSEPQTLADGSLNPSSLVATTGRLRSSSFGVELQTGTEGPLGFGVLARGTAQDYSQTSDPSVYDSTSSSLSARLTLRQVAGGDLGLSLGQNRTTAEDALRSHGQSTTAALSWDRALDGATRLSASLGQTRAQTQKAGVVTNASEGLSGSLGLARDLGAGQVDLGLSFDRDALGLRQSLRLGRTIKLATGTFAAEIGWSMREGNAGAGVGKLSWAQSLPSDALTLSLSRQVALNSDDADTLQTTAAADWRHSFSDRASLGLGYQLGAVTGLNSGVDGVTRQSLTASWQQEIARDWALTTGVTLRALDRDSTGQAQDTAVFLTIGHTFTLLP